MEEGVIVKGRLEETVVVKLYTSKRFNTASVFERYKGHCRRFQ